MSDHSNKPYDEQARPGEPFLARFHRRKLEARRAAAATDEADAAPPADSTPAGATSEAPQPALPVHHAGDDEVRVAPTDADMPPLETLTPDSDYSGFLSPRVSEGLRRAALRKLFHGAEFNVVDGLDEYADDFTRFEALGDVLTADMRHLLEVEARKQAESLKQAVLDGGDVAEAGEATAPAANDAAETTSAEDPTEPVAPV